MLNFSMTKVYTPADQSKVRKRYLLGICSPNVANMLLYNNLLTESEKAEVLEIAKRIALKNNRLKVYMQDFSEALKIWRNQRKQNQKEK